MLKMDQYELVRTAHLKRCLTYGNHKMAGPERRVNELFEDEKGHLLCLPETVFGNVQIPLSGCRPLSDCFQS